MKRKMNTKRLEKLAKLLEKDAAKKDGVKFDLWSWAAPVKDAVLDGFNGQKYFRKKPEKVPVSCGTHACAFGLAAISGVFKKEGLTYGFQRSGTQASLKLVPKFGRKTQLEAAEAFFGLNRDQSFHLFMPGNYDVTTGAKAEREVVRRIRTMIAFERIVA